MISESLTKKWVVKEKDGIGYVEVLSRVDGKCEIVTFGCTSVGDSVVLGNKEVSELAMCIFDAIDFKINRPSNDGNDPEYYRISRRQLSEIKSLFFYKDQILDFIHTESAVYQALMCFFDAFKDDCT